MRLAILFPSTHLQTIFTSLSKRRKQNTTENVHYEKHIGSVEQITLKARELPVIDSTPVSPALCGYGMARAH